jgi:hypothetical protein
MWRSAAFLQVRGLAKRLPHLDLNQKPCEK